MSSVEKGDRIRSGVYTIAEDIVAVDGGQGQSYRRQLQARYLCSGDIASLCFRLDILWGLSGLVVAAICFALIFTLHEANIAYILGRVQCFRCKVFSLTIRRLGDSMGIRSRHGLDHHPNGLRCS